MSISAIKTLTVAGIQAAIALMRKEQQDTAWWAPLAPRVDSTDPDGENQAWLGGVGAVTEKTGRGPAVQRMMAKKFFIANKEWELNVGIPLNVWRHNKVGQVQMAVTRKAAVVAAHPGVLIQTLLGTAETTACYDGQYFFDTDHSEGDSGTQDNDLAATVTSPSSPTESEVADQIVRAVVAIQSFKDDKGNELNLGARRFMVGAGPTLFPKVLGAVRNKLLTNGGSNVVADGRDFEIVPQLLPRVSGNKVVTFNVSPGAAPFVLQTLDDVEESVLDESSEHCKLHGELLFLSRGVYNVGFGLWQDAVLTTFAAP